MAAYNRRAFIKSGIKSSLLAGDSLVTTFAFAAPKRKGWIAKLFDGKSLQGWHINLKRSDTAQGQWKSKTE